MRGPVPAEIWGGVWETERGPMDERAPESPSGGQTGKPEYVGGPLGTVHRLKGLPGLPQANGHETRLVCPHDRHPARARRGRPRPFPVRDRPRVRGPGTRAQPDHRREPARFRGRHQRQPRPSGVATGGRSTGKAQPLPACPPVLRPGSRPRGHDRPPWPTTRPGGAPGHPGPARTSPPQR